MSRDNKALWSGFAVVGALCLIAVGNARAQQTLEEIVVTALKRAENIQDAPASVTAFGTETIEEAGITTMRDYVNLTSNITLMETQNNAFT